jgi:hypothetical protein
MEEANGRVTDILDCTDEGAAHNNGVYPVDAEFESQEFWVLRKFVLPRVHQVIGSTQLQQA